MQQETLKKLILIIPAVCDKVMAGKPTDAFLWFYWGSNLTKTAILQNSDCDGNRVVCVFLIIFERGDSGNGILSGGLTPSDQ